MFPRQDSRATPGRRLTTYSKHFKRRAQPEQRSKDGRVSTAPAESSVWDFHEDEDEIASPDVTLAKHKQRSKQPQRLRPITESIPRPERRTSSHGALALPNPRKRRASVGARESHAARSFSTPPSPPSSTEGRMLPPPLPARNIPLPRPVKTAKPVIRRGYSLGAKKSPATESLLRGLAPTTSARPFTFAAGKSVNDLTSTKPKKPLVQTQIPFRPSLPPPRPAATFSATFSPRRQEKKASTYRLLPTMSDSQAQAAPRKKRRLIDQLAAQADESSSEEETAPSRADAKRAQTPEPQPMTLFDSPNAVPSTPEPSRPRTYGRPDSAKKKTGPKFTYSARRTIRAEASMAGGLETVDENAWLKESLLPSKSQFDMDEDEDEPFATGAVRSIHELRQAGANSRSADEIDDLLTRVGRPSGKPSSSRRNALIELSQKMQDKNFVRKFRDHNGDRSLFEQVGKETDIITGYALVAILTTLVATTASTHIVSQLQDQGFSVLLERLLQITTDVQALARDRASNLSRNGQQSMMKLKASLLILPIWQPTTPFMLSPRRLALKALELVVKNAGTVGDEFFSPEVTDLLFSLLQDSPVPDAWAYPHQDESIDFQLALTLLESHSMVAMQGQLKERWTFRYLPIVAETLTTTLRLSNGRLGEIGMLVLKFTLNTSNNNHDAPMAFIEKGTVRILANKLCDTFVAATNSVYNAEAFQSHLEALLLMLGVMINFSENDRATGRSLLDCENGGQAPLDRLIKLFLDHHVATSEVCISQCGRQTSHRRNLLILSTGRLGGEEPAKRWVRVHVPPAWLYVTVRTSAPAVWVHAQGEQYCPAAEFDTRVHHVSPCCGQCHVAGWRRTHTLLFELHNKAAGSCGATGAPQVSQGRRRRIMGGNMVGCGGAAFWTAISDTLRLLFFFFLFFLGRLECNSHGHTQSEERVEGGLVPTI